MHLMTHATCKFITYTQNTNKNKTLMYLKVQKITWYRGTTTERISGISGIASTHGGMLYNLAMGVESTRSGTRITTAFLKTCTITGAFFVDHAFRTTVGRSSNVIG